MTAPTPDRIPPTDAALLDRAFADLGAHKTAWARTPLRDKIRLLDRLRGRIDRAAAGWAEAAARAKGLEPGSPLVGEEWITGPYAVLAYVDALGRTLRKLDQGRPQDLLRGRVRTRPGGQTVAEVFPGTAADRLLLSGYTAEVWMQPGVTPDELADTMGVFYRERHPAGAVSAVLGAGNIAAIPALDVLYEFYAHGRVVLLKLNPVNEYLGPVFEDVFAEFAEVGAFRTAYGGADVGARITRHPAVEHIHVTGSAATHDAIVYGTGPDGEARKRDDRPEIDTPVTSELGGVSPVVVLPGPWTDADLAYQAEHVATMRTHNGGFNCIASQVLVLPAEWALHDAFVRAVEDAFRALPARPAYYPGADGRTAEALEAHAGRVETFAHGRAILEGVPASDADAHAFQTEFFAPVLATTGLPGRTALEVLGAAVDFCNETLAGTLGASILVHPETLAALGDDFENALGRLRYGTVGVNVWSGAGFLLPQGAWGAFPGHERTDIQSGSGVVHNALLFSRPEKTVVRGPFAPFPRALAAGERHLAPKPPWFATNRTAAVTAERLTRFAAAPSALKLPGLFASALRG